MPKMLKTRINIIEQSRQGVSDRKVLKYDEGYVIQDPKDLITKEFFDSSVPDISAFNELIPAHASSLQGLSLDVYNNTTTLYTGYLSQDGGATYESGYGAGSSVSYVIKDADFILSTPTPATAINYGDKGVLRLVINNTEVDSVNIGSLFNSANKYGSQTYTPLTTPNGKITVVSVDKYNGYSGNQKVVVRMNLTMNDFVKGYNYITLKHTDLPNSGTQVSSNFKVFFDTSLNNPVLNSVVLSVGSNNNPKYLSGVKYLSTNDYINLSASGSYVFDNTYVQNVVSFSGLSGVANGTVAYNDSSLVGVTNPPTVGNPFNLTNKQLQLTVANKCTNAPLVSMTPADPFGTYAVKQNAATKMLISTFGQTSTATQEYFDNETYRLPLTTDLTNKNVTVTNQWDSTIPLVNGNAQQYIITDNDHGLVYPNTDFTQYVPVNVANYTSFSGNQQYLRAFVSPVSKTNITLTLVGVGAGIDVVGSGDVNVQIQLPTQTGLLDCAKPYSSIAGVVNDGSGALSGSITYSGGNATINVTFGGKATFDSNNLMFILITLKNSNRSIKAVNTNW